jgi:phage replication initiation protein
MSREYVKKDKLQPNNDPATFGQNRIVYDYLSFSTKVHDQFGILDYLGLDWNLFSPCPGINHYSRGFEFGGIRVCWDGSSKKGNMGVFVNMSGKGCRFFEEQGTGDYMGLFKLILELQRDSDEKPMNITRLDVAYDDFKGLIPLKKIAFDAENLNYVSRCHRNRDIGKHEAKYLLKGNVDMSEGEIDRNFAQDRDESKRYKGLTVYFGTQKSDFMLRFYDKKAEQEKKDVDSWVRCEMQLRHNCATGFIKRLADGEDVRHLFFGVLNQYIRFLEISDTDSNRRRWKTADYWLNFLEHGEEVSIYDKPGGTYDISNLHDYVVIKSGRAFTTLAALIGFENVVNAIKIIAKEGTLCKNQEFVLKTKFGERYREEFLKSLEYKIEPLQDVG